MMGTRRSATIVALALLVCALAVVGNNRLASATTVQPITADPGLSELILDDHFDLPSPPTEGVARLSAETTLNPDTFAEYALQVNAYYVSRGTTLTAYLGARYPGLLDGQQVYYEEGDDLNNPITMLTFLIEDRLATYNDWQANDTALRSAGFTMDAFVSGNYLGTYGQLRDELLGTHLADIKDYTGDWKADMAVWRPATGEWYIRNSANGTSIVRQLGSSAQGDKLAPGDFDGDRKVDYAIWQPASGNWTIIKSSDGATITRNWGLGSLGDIPVPNDYDGDGKTDIAVWRASTGQWFQIRSSNGTTLGPYWGDRNQGDRPVLGDFDGDGKADLAFWRASTGQWHIRNSSNATTIITMLGSSASGDKPVPGDYDGDYKTDLAVWRPSTGIWTVIRSRDGTTMTQQWGAPTDIPVPADYDSDGKTDLAVWRPSTGQWFQIWSSNGQRTGPSWESQSLGDVPLPSVYIR